MAAAAQREAYTRGKGGRDRKGMQQKREETTEAETVLPNDWRQRRRSQFMTTLGRGFFSNMGQPEWGLNVGV